jgi:protein SERAC1
MPHWQALHRSGEVRKTHPNLAKILPATRGIIFLGTPHRGSGMASLASVVASVTKLALRSTNNRLVQELERDAPTLARIGNEFSRIIDENRDKLVIYSFIEELPSPVIGRKVLGVWLIYY